ncbi:MAG: BolA family protein [Shimia sp.]
MAMKERIENRLTEAFAPTHLDVLDESESHRGHAGYQEGGESHWRVALTTAAFVGQSRIARHRAVHTALGPEIMGEIHALALDLREP